ncbi:AAA family ATPase [Consotaella aegiceratis]|uniref:AAA family ATPase n=1 Tax=Consotaella aegiceratis TaxID=3097961 RepID=UPI002F42EF5C
MRILSLDLLRYGAFSDTSLAFRPNAKLHLVYGPNEAGKSSALSAIGDLLFGFGRQTAFGFQHDMTALRVGATLTASAGTQLSFRRRKGNKNTLLAPEDGEAPLPDDALLPFLGGLNREVFTRAFGLDSAALRTGGDEMLKSDGEIGAAMFAAASGLKGLHDLRQSLEAEADAVFGARARQSRVFDQALARHKQARQEERDSELKAPVWNALNEHIKQLETELDEIRRSRAEVVKSRARLERLRRVAPFVSQIDADLADLEALGPIPDPRPGYAEDLEAALLAHDGARERLASSQTSETKAREAFAHAVVDAPLLKRADEIVALFGETGGIRNNERDLPRVLAERDGAIAELEELASRLGYPDIATLEERRPTDMACAAARALIGRGRDLKDREAKNRAVRREEQEALARLESELHGRGQVVDPQRHRQEFDALAPDIRRIEGRGEAERTYGERLRRLSEACAQLSPPVADLDRLARAFLPGEDAIAQYAGRFTEFGDRRRHLHSRAADTAHEIAALEEEARHFEIDRPVPSHDRIAAERVQRDRHWHRLRAHLVGETPLDVGVLPDAVARFEQSVVASDQLADEAVSDAARVARHADLGRRLVDKRREAERLAGEAAAADAGFDQLSDEWRALWQASGVEPSLPAEMGIWLKAVANLKRERDDVLGLKASVDECGALAERLALPLKALAAALNVPGVERLDPLALARAIEAQLLALTSRWDANRELAVQIREVEARIARCETAGHEIDIALAAWAEEWRAALPSIGLEPVADLVAAEAALDVWDRVPQVLEARDKDDRRVKGMQRDNVAFSQRIGYVSQAVAPDLVGRPAVEIAHVLNGRLADARDAEVRRVAAKRQLDEAVAARETAAAQLTRAEADLERLLSHLPVGADPRAHLERTRAQHATRQRLEERRQQLLATADGLAEASVRAELDGYVPDEAAAKLQELAEDDQRFERRLQEVYAEWDRECRRREGLQAGAGAELAALNRRGAEAELAEASRRWVVLKLGSLLLSKAVERHRAERRDPLMERAGALFSGLTAGAFAGLAEDYGEDDTPRLAGLRPGGERVPLDGLSEGTRDQLYLALRLAYVEDYAARAEPPPFIGDDLFMTFDDERTARGLRALAEIGATVQPILFTHHRHVAEVAEAELGASLDLIELG